VEHSTLFTDSVPATSLVVIKIIGTTAFRLRFNCRTHSLQLSLLFREAFSQKSSNISFLTVGSEKVCLARLVPIFRQTQTLGIYKVDTGVKRELLCYSEFDIEQVSIDPKEEGELCRKGTCSRSIKIKYIFPRQKSIK
jgi:hypothetical protein